MNIRHILLLCLLLLSHVVKAEEATVTFDAAEDKSDGKSISKDCITISVDRGTNTFNSYTSTTPVIYYYKITSGADVTISVASGHLISKVVMYYRTGGTRNGFKNETSDKSYSDTNSKVTWTGSKQNVVLYSKDTNHLTSIEVTYVPAETGTITISEAQHATLWADRAYRMPNGLTGYTISSVANGIEFGQTYVSGSVVPANTPLLLKGNQGTYTYSFTTESGTEAGTNMLECSMGTKVSDEYTYYYKMSYMSGTERVLGFYWDVPDGHSVNIDYGKAYLAVPQEIANGAKGYELAFLTNGIWLPTTERNTKPEIGEIVYDLKGRAYPYSELLPKGIYITRKHWKFVKR